MMKRLHKVTIVVSAVVLLSVMVGAPVAAQEWPLPETVSNAQELAEYQMHMYDIHLLQALENGGAVADRNELAQYQAELAASIGAPPPSGPVPWYVEFNEINDCNRLAQYQARLVDINLRGF